MLRKTLWITFSLFLVGCGVERPDTTLSIVNAGAREIRGYNLKKDYDDNGNIKPGAVPVVKPISTIEDLDKYAVTDPQSLANLKAYVKQLREAYQNCKLSKKINEH